MSPITYVLDISVEFTTNHSPPERVWRIVNRLAQAVNAEFFDGDTAVVTLVSEPERKESKPPLCDGTIQCPVHDGECDYDGGWTP